MLQTPEDRRRIKGIIVNKFRGDRRLFDDGVRMMEEVCGVPVLGVIPYFHDIQIEEEDSVELEQKNDRAAAGRVNVAVVKLLHLSNFTDFDRLERDGRVHLYYTDRADELQKADVIVLPGSKSTLDDLRELKRNGLAEAVVQAARSGKTVMGICGGYQMMGTEVADPGGVEGTPARLSGLGLLPVHTVIGREKVTRQVEFRFRGSGTLCRGYEIHMGRTVADEAGQSFVPLNRLADGTADRVLRPRPLHGDLHPWHSGQPFCLGFPFGSLYGGGGLRDHGGLCRLQRKAIRSFGCPCAAEFGYGEVLSHLVVRGGRVRRPSGSSGFPHAG